jgi:hypothetical protein
LAPAAARPRDIARIDGWRPAIDWAPPTLCRSWMTDGDRIARWEGTHQRIVEPRFELAAGGHASSALHCHRAPIYVRCWPTV